MKVENSSGREYHLQRSKDNFMAKWCLTVTPSRIDLEGTTVEAFGDAEKSNYIYLAFEGTTYCLWAKDPRNFEFLEETSLRITDRRRPRSGTKKASTEQPPRDVGKSPKFQMGKEEEPLTRENLDAVLVHFPQLREQVDARGGDPDAAEGLYSEAFSSSVRKVVKALFQHRFMFPFNYQPWMDEARKLEESRELLANADLETLRKLVVVHWRQDYWDYDHTHWESIAANGHLVALLDRLQEIAVDMEPAPDAAMDDEGVAEDRIVYRGSAEDAEVEEGWPTVAELMEGFDRIREKITPQQMTMLQVNYYSGGRAATMRELASASGYGDYRIANIQYGGLAKRLYKAIGYPAPQSQNSSNTYWVLGIGEFVDRREFGLEMQCVMRPAVAKALEELGMVESLDGVFPMEEVLDESDGEIVDMDGSNSRPGAATSRKDTSPTVKDLVAAFDRIRDKITPQQRAMLVLNYAAGERGVTLWELTQVCDSKVPDPKFGWSVYIHLAGMVYKELGFSHAEFEALRESYWDLVLAKEETCDDEMVGNYGVVLVMRPEVAEALEKVEIVDSIKSHNDSSSTSVPMSSARAYTAYAWDDPDEILPPVSEINDFIVYHNPDVMGPLADESTFEVFTNKSVSGAKQGDRVWLITGEGTPRKFSLACWFYIDEFQSGGDLGLKHCVSGSEGEAFSPFIEIPQDEWFTQLKQDQGNFAFGFSRISTPGAVEGFKTMAGIVEAAGEASPGGHRSVSLADLAVLARLHSRLAEISEYVKANPDDSGDYIPSTISIMEIILNRMGIYIEFDVESWTDEAKRLSGDAGQIGNADLLTLRKLLTCHRHQSQDSEYPDHRDLGYWIDFALKGDLLAILGRFEELYQLAIQDRMNEILHGPRFDEFG